MAAQPKPNQQNRSTFLIPTKTKTKKHTPRKPQSHQEPNPKAQSHPESSKIAPEDVKPEINADQQTHKHDQQPETQASAVNEGEKSVNEGQTVPNNAPVPNKSSKTPGLPVNKPGTKTMTPQQIKSAAYKNAFVDALTDGVPSADILKIFAGLATNKEALAVLTPVLPQLFKVIVSGSLIRGTAGSTDRATVMNMLGMPWSPGRRFAPGASDAGVRTPAARVQDWSGRFERAMNGAMPAEVRHTLGTLMADDDEISAFSPEIEE